MTHRTETYIQASFAEIKHINSDCGETIILYTLSKPHATHKRS